MYKYEDSDRVIECIFKGGEKVIQKKMSSPDAQTLVDAGEAIIYDTHEELNETVAYSENRRDGYPPIEDQLDQIYHEGIDVWKETIQAVKDAHPKPE